MNPKTCFKVAVLFVLLNFVSAGGNVGGLGQRPKCGNAVKLLNVVDDLANPILEDPCEIVTCLLNFTCQRKCESPLLTSVLGLVAGLVNTPVCNRGLLPCPDNLAIERCLNTDGRKSILGI